MARPARAPVPPPAKAPVAALHRRRQQVVVRAPGATSLIPPVPTDRRASSMTLPGLGFRAEADTLPALGAQLPDEDNTPISCVRVKTAPRSTILPPPPDAATRARRPVTLLDDVHDALSRDYLDEARRLLESGMFDVTDDD